MTKLFFKNKRDKYLSKINTNWSLSPSDLLYKKCKRELFKWK